jgi:hypothetical protein
MILRWARLQYYSYVVILQDPVVSLIWRLFDQYFTYPMLVHVRIYIVSRTVKYDRRYISLLEKYLDMLSCTEFFSAKSLHRILCRLTQNSVQTYTEFCADLHRILCTQNSVQMHMMLYELHSTTIIIEHHQY